MLFSVCILTVLKKYDTLFNDDTYVQLILTLKNRYIQLYLLTMDLNTGTMTCSSPRHTMLCVVYKLNGVDMLCCYGGLLDTGYRLISNS